MYTTSSYKSSIDKNNALCRKFLDSTMLGNIGAVDYATRSNIKYFKINGVTRFWETEEDFNLSSLIGDILNSFVQHDTPFSYAIVGEKDGISVYVGSQKQLGDSLITTYASTFPGIDIDAVSEDPLLTCTCNYGGLFTGIPTDKLSADKKSYQIENICRGMQGKRFVYVIHASGIGKATVTYGHERLLAEMEEIYSNIKQTYSGGSQGNISSERQDFATKNYFDNLEALEETLKNGESRGMWRVNGYYAAETEIDAHRLANIIKASYSGEESKPDPFRVLESKDIRPLIQSASLITELIEDPEFHPLGRWFRNDIQSNIHLYVYKYQTLLTSDQLGTLCQLPTKEFPGYYIDEYVEFDVANRVLNTIKEPVPLGDICVAGRKSIITSDNKYLLEKNDLTRHSLIIGITGGGKTNTSKSLLNTLWNAEVPQKRVPFMVIESAKREYWELRNLKGFEDLLVFTLGNEAKSTSVKYRINPFETNPHISLQTHIDYLLSTFKAAFELYPPMPYVLEQAVYEVYSDRGWDIVENTNRYGLTEYPTLTDLYHKIDVVVDALGYHQEVQSNVKAALQARIYSLMIGGKGAMLDTPKSVPIQDLLSRPVVMELEDLGDDETKSFVIGILLVQLYEYRKSQMTKGSKQLSHILMVEEAHRLLKNVTESGEGGNTRAKSVEFFCNMLAEIRTFGQGIIIADQIPTKLAPDTLKNTNLKIVHRTVSLDDREAIGKAMNMTEEQIDYLSSLNRGYAAVYAEGDNRPKCVKFPLVVPFYDKNRVQVIDEVKTKVYTIADKYDEIVRHHPGCTFCEKRCEYYSKIKEYINNKINISGILTILEKEKYSPSILSNLLNNSILKPLNIQSVHEEMCVLGYLLSHQKNLKFGQKQSILAEFLKYKKSL